MAYIKFPAFPDTTNGRTLTGGVTNPDTGEYAAVTNELLDTDTEITVAEYSAIYAAAEAAYEAEQASKE